jgi:KUP system potassium uptake protein
LDAADRPATVAGHESFRPKARRASMSDVPVNATRVVEAPRLAKKESLAALAFAALGVVYGDIGTSPLYAMRECFHGDSLAPTRPAVLGVLSLVFWSIVVVVCVKYLTLILKVDNRGEGGILALVALLSRKGAPAKRTTLIALGAFGAALLYGDGMITPVITVFGAVEGMDVATPALRPYIVPTTVVILAVLFYFQKRGTHGVAKVFAPVTLLWFLAIAATGIGGLAKDPSVLAALSPHYGILLLVETGPKALVLLGAVVLVVTGAEALYADLGHFGRKPIRLAWYAVALPALLLNYFGQGAAILADPKAAKNPFYALAPDHPVAKWGLIAVATAAAVVASQALISGAFSLTHQAMQLGYSPRVTVVHTSGAHSGQIYIPEVNLGLALGCVGLALGFGSSSAIAGAYGVSVTGTMIITSVLFYAVARDRWKWGRFKARAILGAFLVFDVAFLAANLVKVDDGGWFTLLAAGAVYCAMATWRRGRERIAEAAKAQALPMASFLRDLERLKPHRVRGTAVFMTSNPDGVPLTLLHHLRHNQVLHEQVVLTCVVTEEVPEIPDDERIGHDALGQGIHQVIVRYGFLQTPNVMAALLSLRDFGLDVDPERTTYYLGRQTFLATSSAGLPKWRKRLFVFLHRNAPSATVYYNIPPSRVVEVGAQIEL